MTNDEIKKILDESYAAKAKQKRYVIKYVCGHGGIEITEPRDQILICPKCGKKQLLIWQAKPKVEYEK